MADHGGSTTMTEVTNLVEAVNFKDEEGIKRSRAAGWAEPEGYDYDAYKPVSAEDRGLLDQVDVPAWAAEAAKYEWKEEYGNVAPRLPELERMLFGDEFRPEEGASRDSIQKIDVTVDSETKIKPVRSFDDAGLHPVMMENLALCKYRVPTPIQAYTMPAIVKGIDIIAVAQTGSGKTAAFLIPVLSKLMGKAKQLAAPRPLALGRDFDPLRDGVRAEPLVLIIAPTRELSTQIFDETRRLCYRSMLRPCVAYGGAPARGQMDELRKGCDILIGTPGRLIDFIEKGHLLSFNRLKYTIIDEADEMVSDDWNEDMKRIMSGGDNNEDADHIYMMFSATFPKGARALAKEYMAADHIRVRVGRAGSSHGNVAQKVYFANNDRKKEALFDLLLAMPPSRTIVFVNSKRAADFVDDYLYNKGLPSTSIHSDRTQREREDAIRAFRSAKAPILIATGVSARGIDIKNVMHVVNYDLPSSMHGGITEYIHRIGRTARIGNVGLATSFYNEKNEDIAPDLVRVLLETHQEVPDFLEQWQPADTNVIDFEDDSEDEADAGAGANEGGGWGNVFSATPLTTNDTSGTNDTKDTNDTNGFDATNAAGAADADAW